MKTWLLLVLAFGFSEVVCGGSLEPSAGPTTGTMKTLDQVEPRTAITSIPWTISASGSYYLASSLTATNSQNGITIAADNVSIDLKGFKLDGNRYSAHCITGSGRTNIAIRNGTICNWYGFGTGLSGCTSVTVENLTVSNTSYSGIQAGANSMVFNCRVSGVRVNSYSAISMTGACIIKDSIVADNNYVGIHLQDRSIVSGCIVKSNGSTGITGSMNSIIKDCVCTANGGYGIRVEGGSIVSNCSIVSNTDHGIYLYSSEAINNFCSSNGSGNATNGAGIFITGTGCRVEGNTAVGNNKYGFNISSTSNWLVRNTARSNGASAAANYSVSGGSIGPISSDMATTSPWANFSF